jgi:hypothetical protein
MKHMWIVAGLAGLVLASALPAGAQTQNPGHERIEREARTLPRSERQRLLRQARALLATLTPEQRARLEKRLEARLERRVARWLSRPGAAERIERKLARTGQGPR